MKLTNCDYSKAVEHYDATRPLDATFVQNLIKYGQLADSMFTLDIGCGTGRFTVPLCYGKRIHACGTDISIDMLRRAKQKDKKQLINWIRSDAHMLPFRDGQFDAAYAALVIHQAKRVAVVLKEVYRILRNKGICVIVTKSHSQIAQRIEYQLFPHIASIDYKRFPSISSLVNLLQKAGFREVEKAAVKRCEFVDRLELIERVEKKHLSTLHMLPKDKFDEGFQKFLQRISNDCDRDGTMIRRKSDLTYVVAQK